MEDAEVVVFTLGSVAGAVREMVDVKRDSGYSHRLGQGAFLATFSPDADCRSHGG